MRRALALLLLAGTARAAGVDSPKLGMHAFVHPWLSTQVKIYILDAAAATGKTRLLMDFSMEQMRKNPGKIDESVKLAEARGLKILGVLGGIPKGDGDICKRGFGPFVGAVVKKYPEITAWEIVNEPNVRQSFDGGPYGYACNLVHAAQAIRKINPKALVVFGGISVDPKSPYDGWLEKVLKHPRAMDSFDAANIHVRGSLEHVADAVAQARRAFSRYAGRAVPLWVTEHGFPTDEKFQKGWDERFASGEAGQARYLKQSVPALLNAGAAMVFVTLRDQSAQYDPGRESCARADNKIPYCTEGLITMPEPGSGGGRRKPAFDVFSALAP